MSVVFFGVSVAQVVEPALLGSVLLLLGVLLTGVLRRSSHRRIHNPIQEQNPLAARWFDGSKRLLSVFSTPRSPRAPPTNRFGPPQPIPVPTRVYRRRRMNCPNELS